MPTVIKGYSGSISVASGTSIAFSTGSPSVLVDSGDHETFTSSTLYRYLDRTQSVTVQTNVDGGGWTTQPSTSYTVQYVGGIITFNAAITFSTSLGVRLIAGAYLLSSVVASAKTWEMNLLHDMEDVTTFQGYGSQGFKQFLPTLAGADVKMDLFWVDNTFLSLLTGSNTFIVSLNTGRNSTGDRYEGYARLKGDGVKSDVKSVITEALDMVIDGQPYYFAQ